MQHLFNITTMESNVSKQDISSKTISFSLHPFLKYSDLTYLVICKLKSLDIYWETYLLHVYANDLLKIWLSIFFFKTRNVRPCKYRRPCYHLCKENIGVGFNLRFRFWSQYTTTIFHATLTLEFISIFLVLVS